MLKLVSKLKTVMGSRWLLAVAQKILTRGLVYHYGTYFCKSVCNLQTKFTGKTLHKLTKYAGMSFTRSLFLNYA